MIPWKLGTPKMSANYPRRQHKSYSKTVFLDVENRKFLFEITHKNYTWRMTYFQRDSNARSFFVLRIAKREPVYSLYQFASA